MTTKKVVATGNENGAQRVDPAVVRAEDLVRAVQNRSIIKLATQMGWRQTIMDYNGSEDSRRRAAYYVAQRITLPEDGEALPFSEPINDEDNP